MISGGSIRILKVNLYLNITVSLLLGIWKEILDKIFSLLGSPLKNAAWHRILQTMVKI